MKDIEKTSVNRNNSRKRMRRRKRFVNVYVIVVILLVSVCAIAMSYTFLFNIDEIKVSGESDNYTAEEIVDASGIKRGDNLLRVDLEKSEQKILDELVYVETVDIKREFPITIEIKVTKCVPSYKVKCGNSSLLVSKQGKVLEENVKAFDNLPIVTGYEPEEHDRGTYIGNGDSFKDNAFKTLITNIAKLENPNITGIDMTDEHDIIITYKNGMVFKMGNWSDAEYKFSLAETVMNDDTVKGKKGYLTMIGNNQCSFRTSKEPAEIPGKKDHEKPKKTDENGNPVEEVKPNDESNPDQEQIFDDYNNREDDGSDYFNFENETAPNTENSEDGGYYGDDGIYYDEYGGYYDSWGYYHDQWGGYYDSWGNYYDSYGNLIASSGYSEW